MSDPTDWLDGLVGRIEGPDDEAVRQAWARQAVLTKPKGSLGRLEELAVRVAGMTGWPLPAFDRRAVVVAAADHGVAAAGVSAYPQSVTIRMIANFLRGGAAINVLARQVGARVVVVDAGTVAPLGSHPVGDGAQGVRLVHRPLGAGTGDITKGPAMSHEQALGSLRLGAQVLDEEVERGLDIVAVGEMGIANTTSAAAVAACLTGEAPQRFVGSGSGLDAEGRKRKTAAVARALALHRPDPGRPLEVLASVGGFELGALAGLMLAAAARRRPIVLDGHPATAGAMLAAALAPGVRQFLIAGHRSSEAGHDRMLEWLGLAPLLDLELRLGEGSGAALAMGLVLAACRTLRDMAAFDEAGVACRIES